MMFQVFSAAEVLTIPTADRPVNAGLTGASATRDRKDAWFVVENLSPHLFQLLDEEGSVLAIIWPWSQRVTPLRPAGERRQVVLHPVVKSSTSVVVPIGVWCELTTVLPIPSAVFIAT